MAVKVMMVIMMMRIIIKMWKRSFADVLQNRFSEKLLEFLFNKVAILLKTGSSTGVFLWNLQTF